MKAYRATRSFFGDLGSIRRNQVLTLGDDAKKEVAHLLKRGLLIEHVQAADEPPKPRKEAQKPRKESEGDQP